jgi:hypothetical protein
MSERPTFDVDKERAVLGEILTAAQMGEDVRQMLDLQAECFHDSRNRHIWRATQALDGKLPAADSLIPFLESKGEKYLNAAGGKTYVYGLLTDAAAPGLARQYTDELRDLARLRALTDARDQLSAILTTRYKGDPEEAAREIGRQLVALERPRAQPIELLSATDILTGDWPEPVWAIPQLLPVGLAILAGKPKVGKSWLALQIAQAVAAGGAALGERVQAGPVLYLALEDPPRRLQERMGKQGWPAEVRGADFVPLGTFQDQIGPLRGQGAQRLATLLEQGRYRLTVIDTFSRSIPGDQNDNAEMTAALEPLHRMANEYNAVVLLVDHHGKLTSSDAVSDILGSTAKGGMADCLWGLYRERGKPGAKLSIDGREVIPQNLALTFDGLTCCWQSEGDADELAITEKRQEIIDALETLGRSGVSDIAEAVERNRGSVYRDLQELASSGHVMKVNKSYGLP